MIATPTYQRCLGEQLRLARLQRGWTLGDLAEAILHKTGTVMSTRTLASYERGTRACTMLRLRTVCNGLAVDPGTVLSAMQERARDDHPTIEVTSDADLVVDLTLLVHSVPLRLAPLRSWAAAVLAYGRAQHVAGRPTWRLSPETFAPIAELCAVSPGQVRLLLGQYLHASSAKTSAARSVDHRTDPTVVRDQIGNFVRWTPTHDVTSGLAFRGDNDHVDDPGEVSVHSSGITRRSGPRSGQGNGYGS